MRSRRRVVSALVCAALLVVPVVANAQGLDEQLRSLEAKLKAAEAKLAELTEKLALAERRVRKLEAEVLELSAENAQLRRKQAGAPDTSGPAPTAEPTTPDAQPDLVPTRRDDPALTVVRDRKHLDALTATPVSFHNVVLARAAALGLTAGKPDEKQLRTGEEALNRWATEQKLVGTRVAWTLRVDSADDTFAEQRITLLADQLAQDQENLTRYQRQRDSILADTADPDLYRTLGKEKTLEQLRGEIARLNERVPELTRELWDAKLYTVAVRLSVPGRDDVVVRGDFHKEDKLALQGALPDRALTISGNIRRIRCDLTPTGRAVFPVELARCRLAGR